MLLFVSSRGWHRRHACRWQLAYINEFIGAHKRDTSSCFEVIFPIGLMFAGMAGYFLVPIYGWKAMFVVGLVPSILAFPLRWFMPESPRWLASKGRIAKPTLCRENARERCDQAWPASARTGGSPARSEGDCQV